MVVFWIWATYFLVKFFDSDCKDGIALVMFIACMIAIMYTK